MRSSHRLPTVATALAGAALLALSMVPSGAAERTLPPLDRPALRESLAGLPDREVTAGQVRVSGAEGRWHGRAGVRDLASGAPVPGGARFRIASATKMFTAAVVLQLAGEGRLDLDAPVQRYLPRVLPRAYPSVPVGRLLDHTSGLPASTEDEGSADPAWVVAHRFDHHTPREIVDSATRRPMEFAPGTRQHYNGVNYFLAGMLVEKVTGHAFADELRQRILHPLGLRDTYLPRPKDVTVAGPHARAYVLVHGVPIDVTEQSAYGWAESGLISTTADLDRFLTQLLSGRLLPRAQQAALFTVPDVPYWNSERCPGGADDGRACFSMGLNRTPLPGGPVVWGKSGGLPGYTTAAFATRDLKRVLVLSLNATGNRDGSDGDRLQGIVGAAFGS